MARKLPPLKALRAFEAAARHLSFTQAAAELHVTQAAISHQVKILEENLGLPLFRRLNRRLVLTAAGQIYLPVLREAFDRIAAGTKQLYKDDDSGPLQISVLPSLAAKWLLPRMSRFRDRHPDIDVMISANNKLVDFSDDSVEMGVRYGRGEYPGLQVDLLLSDEVFPVCSPSLMKGPHPLRTPDDLRHHTLLHDEISREDESPDWRSWLRAAGVTGVDWSRGPGFSDSSMVIEAAAAVQGVALGHRWLAAADLDSGRLVQPFGPSIPSKHAYYIVCPPALAERRRVRLFREWLLEEAERTSAETAALASC
ncbi:transcriptional regulator GcvA [Pelagibius litoralis]|uniref:Transcriptional regulator GcvA n=1 Tax=Pelagibius litoralis TaxID=374515 RepID=A0A967EY56_9PROT|nr:transcriptional regulator GcvA [Pelagibius litoralis]NIA69576.1 transcriptional regulator GcvA [Pelagibius litoralis]